MFLCTVVAKGVCVGGGGVYLSNGKLVEKPSRCISLLSALQILVAPHRLYGAVVFLLTISRNDFTLPVRPLYVDTPDISSTQAGNRKPSTLPQSW